MGICWSVSPDKLLQQSDPIDTYADFAVRLFNAIVAKSPVDTGIYRGNHIMTVGYQDFSYDTNQKEPRKYDKSFYGRKDFVPIYIQNNLPYAYRLEHGHSKQAPQGVYMQALQEITHGL